MVDVHIQQSRRTFLAAATVGLTAAAGCLGDDDSERAIGVPTPQSGPLEPDGTAGIRGIDVALAELEEELDDPIESIAEDGEASPDRALSVVRDMIDDGVPAITGTFSSDVSNALSDHVENEEVPFLTAISVDPEITDPDDEYTFRMTGDTTQKLKGVGEFFEEEGVSGLGVIAADYSMGHSAVEFMEERAGEYGMTLEHDAILPLETDNFVPELQDVDTDDVDALFYPFPGGNGPTLVSQTREQGLFDDVDIILGHDSYGTEVYLEALGEDSLDMYFWGVELDNEDARQANQRMEEMFDVRMDPLSLPNYDAIHMIAQVIEEQGSTDPQDVRDGLADIDYRAASGWDVSFDDSGDNEAYQMVISQWQDGEAGPENVVQFKSDVVSTA